MLSIVWFRTKLLRLDVVIACRLQNAVFHSLNSESSDRKIGYRVHLKPNGRQGLTFPIDAGMPGTVRIQFGGVGESKDGGPGFADAAQVDFTSYTPATSEAFATYGSVVKDGETLSSTIEETCGCLSILWRIADHDLFNDSAKPRIRSFLSICLSYPHLCSEQIASKMLAVIALRDVLTAFGKLVPKDITPDITKWVKELQSRQRSDGRFEFAEQIQTTHISPFMLLTHSLRHETKDTPLHTTCGRILKYLRSSMVSLLSEDCLESSNTANTNE